jgi:MFS family permease
MRIVAVPWQVFQLTDSTVAVGIIGLVEVVPLIIFSIWGGVIADRVDRRKVIAWSQVGMLVSSLTLAALSFGDAPSLTAVYVITGVWAAFSAIDRPARAAIVPSLVTEAQLPAAIALRQVVFHSTQILGPALGGVMIAALGGVAWVYVADAGTFVVALVALLWVPRVTPLTSDEESRSQLHSIVEGLRFTFSNSLILSIFVIDLVAMIFGMPRAVFPALAQNTFDMGARGAGLLYAAPSVGALIGALTTGWVKGVERQGLAVIVAVAVWGLAIALAGLSLFSLPLTLTFLAIAAAADVVSAIFRGTMLQVVTPDRLLGRVNSANFMIVTGGPRLGDLEAGLVAGAFGAPASVVIGGVACLAGTAIVAKVFPGLRAYRSDAARRSE